MKDLSLKERLKSYTYAEKHAPDYYVLPDGTRKLNERTVDYKIDLALLQLIERVEIIAYYDPDTNDLIAELIDYALVRHPNLSQLQLIPECRKALKKHHIIE